MDVPTGAGTPEADSRARIADELAGFASLAVLLSLAGACGTFVLAGGQTRIGYSDALEWQRATAVGAAAVVLAGAALVCLGATDLNAAARERRRGGCLSALQRAFVGAGLNTLAPASICLAAIWSNPERALAPRALSTAGFVLALSGGGAGILAWAWVKHGAALREIAADREEHLDPGILRQRDEGHLRVLGAIAAGGAVLVGFLMLSVLLALLLSAFTLGVIG